MEASVSVTTGDVPNTKQVFLPQETLDDPFDVTLVVEDGKEFKAHRRVLSGASSFFEKLLHSDMRESNEGVIRLEMLNEICLREILEFIYTGSVQISAEENARDLIAMADYLVLPHLKTVAGNVLVDKLNASNSISTYRFAERYRCKEVVSGTRNFIHANFTAVSKTKDFLSLSSEEVKMWISSDEINVSVEEDVFKIIVAWIDSEESERKKYFPELFCEVRLVYISREFLNSDIMTNDLVTDNEACMNLVKDALKIIDSKGSLHRSIQPRKSLETPVIVMHVGGFSRQEDNMFCCYYPCEDTWCRLHGVVPRYIGHAVSCHGKLYLTIYHDYEDSGMRLHCMMCYDSFSNSWSSLPYEDHRTLCKLFVRNEDEIYAFVAEDIISCPDCIALYKRQIPGPCSKTPHLSFIRKYKPESNTWEDISSFDLDCNSRSGVCVVAKDNFIYFIGGVDSTRNPYPGDIADVDRYDLSTNTWEKVANLQLARGYARATATHSNIFVVGGVNRDLIAESCEVYSEAANEWHFIAKLRKTPFDHYSPTLLGVDNKLYSIICHICTWNRKDKIDCYDTERDEWSEKTQIPFETLLPREFSKYEFYLQISSCCLMRVFKGHNFLQQASFPDKDGKHKCTIM